MGFTKDEAQDALEEANWNQVNVTIFKSSLFKYFILFYFHITGHSNASFGIVRK